GLRFAIFVDTEEEFDWSEPRSRDATGTSHIKFLPEFQRLADSIGIKPCYLIDYPVAAGQESAETIAAMHADGNCTIGTQLHAWVNPPFDEDVTTFNSFPGNLPPALERAKLSLLTERITAVIGERPTIYRAGRYGIGPNSAGILRELGYQMDVSIRPQFDYSHEGGPDFTGYDPQPFWAGADHELLEMPLSVAYTGLLRRFGRLLYGRSGSTIRGGLARSGMLSRVALTPEDMPINDVKTAIDALIRDGVQCLSFSFHSPSVVPGHTPYVRNSAQLSEFYRWWEKIIAHLGLRGVTPVGSDEILAAARTARDQST
ncbi:MAG: hypothetical protein RL367_1572, partial [Pseudomonadota bacterium]